MVPANTTIGGRLIVFRMLGALSLFGIATTEALGWQCQPMSKQLASADVVFIGRPVEIVRHDAVVHDEQSRIGGTPDRYDLVRFDVVESLKGERSATLDLLCPADDAMCRPSEDGSPLLVALPSKKEAQTLTLFCNIAYLVPHPGWGTPDDEAIREWLDVHRAARRASDGAE